MIRTHKDVTPAVQRVMDQTADPRLRRIMHSLVAHLHDFVRDVRLTGESGDRLTLSRVNLDYTISGLRARRIDSILVEGGSVRARYGEDGLTVAGFKVGGGGGGAPPVSIGSMEARGVGLTLETGEAVLAGLIEEVR